MRACLTRVAVWSLAAAAWLTLDTALAIDGAGGIDIGVASDVAIDMHSSTLDIDASGTVSIDACGGSITVGTR